MNRHQPLKSQEARNALGLQVVSVTETATCYVIQLDDGSKHQITLKAPRPRVGMYLSELRRPQR